MSPRLGQHLPEPFVEVHPDDAARYGVADGDFARVTTDYGQCTLRVVVSERQQRGMLFAPIHWSEANATGARVGSLVAPYHRSVLRPAREQGDAGIDRALRICVPRLCAVAQAARAARRMPGGARVAVNGGYGYLFADNADLAGWQSWLKSFAARRSRRIQGFRRRRLSRGVL